MPKMKSSRLAMKKFRVGAKGTIKAGRGNTSHNTGKKSSKRMRQLRGRVVIDSTKELFVARLLPYAATSK